VREFPLDGLGNPPIRQAALRRPMCPSKMQVLTNAKSDTVLAIVDVHASRN
jgi:hypothetical protein